MRKVRNISNHIIVMMKNYFAIYNETTSCQFAVLCFVAFFSLQPFKLHPSQEEPHLRSEPEFGFFFENFFTTEYIVYPTAIPIIIYAIIV